MGLGFRAFTRKQPDVQCEGAVWDGICGLEFPML